jgi:hypothetical protein
VDKMLATHRHIQESIFHGGNVVQHLKHMISSRFAVDDVPDGFLFFPVELGGLDLKSPFVNLLQIRESVRENPYDLIDEFLDKESEDYLAVKALFEKGAIRNERETQFVPEDAKTFPSFDEFTKFRESFNPGGQSDIRSTYNSLLHRPSETPIDVSVQVSQAINQLGGAG